jgi:hypothetical protein
MLGIMVVLGGQAGSGKHRVRPLTVQLSGCRAVQTPGVLGVQGITGQDGAEARVTVDTDEQTPAGSMQMFSLLELKQLTGWGFTQP